MKIKRSLKTTGRTAESSNKESKADTKKVRKIEQLESLDLINQCRIIEQKRTLVNLLLNRGLGVLTNPSSERTIFPHLIRKEIEPAVRITSSTG